MGIQSSILKAVRLQLLMIRKMLLMYGCWRMGYIPNLLLLYLDLFSIFFHSLSNFAPSVSTPVILFASARVFAVSAFASLFCASICFNCSPNACCWSATSTGLVFGAFGRHNGLRNRGFTLASSSLARGTEGGNPET